MEEMQNLKDSNPLGYEKIGKLLPKFAIPSIVAMLINAVYNIVDQIFIQHKIGSDGNAATTVAFPIVTFTLGIALLIGVGGASLASVKLGEKKKEEAEKVLGNAFVLIVVFSIFFGIICTVFLEPILKFLGAGSDSIMEYSKTYVSIILKGTLFMAVGSGLSAFVRADGSPKVSMMSMVAGCVLNIILDYVFMFRLVDFGLNNMGIEGAAYGTIISQFLTAVVVMIYLLFKGNIRIKTKYFKLNRKLCTSFCALGVSSFITQFANAVVQICMNNLLNYYANDSITGGQAMSAMGITLKTNMILFGICIGIAQGSQPIIGYNHGARKYKRVRSAYLISTIAATIVSTVGWIAIELFPSTILSIYGDNDPVMKEFAVKAMKVFLGGFCVAGFNVVSSHYFQSVEKAKQAFAMSMGRQIIALVPLMFIFPLFMGIEGILWAGMAADVIALALGVVLVSIEMKKLNKLCKIS